jgi:hypothetical protein
VNLKALQSANRGAAWLKALLDPATGALRGGTDLRAYYKTPCAFHNNGLFAEADLVLDHLERRYLRESGDLDGEGVPWFSIYRTYPHSWICFAAALRERHALAQQLAGFIVSWHNPASGGFYAGEARDLEEIMTTSMAGIALLHAGRIDIAEAAGAWLRNLWRQQPDLVQQGLYTACRNGVLITEYAEAEAAGFLVDVRKSRQWYFQYGIAAALLTSLAKVTGKQEWRTLADGFLSASSHAAEDRYKTPQSGKISWGAAWAGDAVLSATVAEGLCALQNGDGSWLATGVYGGETAEADSVTIDVTAEFTTLQAYNGMEKV